jgi:hypothetical protein
MVQIYFVTRDIKKDALADHQSELYNNVNQIPILTSEIKPAVSGIYLLQP